MKKLTLSIFIAASTAAQAASITDFSHGMNSMGQYELVFKGAQVLPNVFTTTGPDSIVLDFSGTDSQIGKREISIGNAGIYDVDVIDAGERTRAVINLAAPLNYQVMQRGKDIAIVFSPTQTVAATSINRNVPNNGLFNNVGAANTSPQVRISTPNSNTNRVSVNQSTNSDPSLTPRFTKKNANTAALAFGLPATVENVNVRQNGNKIVASLDGYYAPRTDLRRMEVASYATVVDYVDVVRTARGTDLILGIKRNQPFEFSSFQNSDVYTIEVKKPHQNQDVRKQIEELEGFGPGRHYKGSPLSLNFQDIEVRAVLQIIAEFTNNNIVVSDAVTGNITLRLDNVPWDQALDIILKTKGLGMRQNGSVIYIAPSSELDSREIQALELIQKRDQLVPTRTELIQVKYSNADDLATIIRESSSASAASGEYFKDSILSSKGSITVDARTNTLLVSDIPSRLQAVRDLVARLDEPVRQVLVDARLVITTDDFSRSLGSKFGVTFFNTGNNRLVSGSGTAGAANGLNNALAANMAAGGDSAVAMPNLTDRLGVNMPSPGSSYGLAILGADFLVDLELSALQTEGKVEIVSSPRVVTQDGKAARIAAGQQIPYTSVSDGGTKVEFKNAELSLDVTPRIAPDDRVDMILNVSKDSPNAALQSGGNISINTNQLETNVLVDNGETIVLGGIYEQTQSLSTEKVPLLGDLPLIGNAFKTNTKKFNKNELIIFVTPRIIDNRLTDYDKFSNLRN